MGHEQCIHKNQTDIYGIGNVYGGIPTNLITNAVCFVILLVLFIFIRKRELEKTLKRIGNIVQQSEDISKWTQVFFGSKNSEQSINQDVPVEDATEEDDDAEDGNVPQEIQRNGTVVQIQENEDHNEEVVKRLKPIQATEEVKKRSSRSSVLSQLAESSGDSFFSWFIKTMTLSDEKMQELAGFDALQYLRFQRYLMVFVAFTSVLSITVILPLNFQGNLKGNNTDFGHTTLANLPGNSPYLWVHTTLAFILFPIAIFMMRHFSVALKFHENNLEISRTLVIEGVKKEARQEEKVAAHFKEAYPRFEVTDIKFAYDVAKLYTLSAELKNVSEAKVYGENRKERMGEDAEMIPYTCSRWCSCFCSPCVNKVSVVDYYKKEEERLDEEVKQATEKAKSSPLEMMFVTFSKINDSMRVFQDHNNGKSVVKYKHVPIFQWHSKPPESKVSDSLGVKKWKVWYAPPPSDMYWENLAMKRYWLLLRSVVVNFILLIVVLFLTTPEYITNRLQPILNYIYGSITNGTIAGNPIVIPTYITDFLPTLLLWSFTALLPLLVSYSIRYLGHWTRSGENHSIMRKTFWYLLVMVVIFPTFGFTTAEAYLQWVIQNQFMNSTETFQWECIFLPDSGAFFVNYVITSALIGCGLELMRIPEMLWYLIQACLSKSKAETPAIRRAVIYEFMYGEQYARLLLMFALVTMFSISCPLITPFGCIYFGFKHFVDRHNLAFVYAPSKINKKVHISAINFVILSVGLLQFFMVAFTILRSGEIANLTYLSKYTLALFVITINIFSAQVWAATCKKLSPIKYVDVLYNEDMDENNRPEYLPDVLKGKGLGLIKDSVPISGTIKRRSRRMANSVAPDDISLALEQEPSVTDSASPTFVKTEVLVNVDPE